MGAEEAGMVELERGTENGADRDAVVGRYLIDWGPAVVPAPAPG